MIVEGLKKKIDSMSHRELAIAWRFLPFGDPMFEGEAGKYFQEVFKKKGGMTTAISKEIGWDRKKALE
jgi:hypothetical protein